MSTNSFTNKVTGEKVQIIDEDNVFYTLNGGVKIKKETLKREREFKNSLTISLLLCQ